MVKYQNENTWSIYRHRITYNKVNHIYFSLLLQWALPPFSKNTLSWSCQYNSAWARASTLPLSTWSIIWMLIFGYPQTLSPPYWWPRPPILFLISLLWLLCLVLNGVWLFPTYWPLHLLQVAKYMTKDELQFRLCLIWYFLCVLVLTKCLPSFSIGQATLHFPHLNRKDFH